MNRRNFQRAPLAGGLLLAFNACAQGGAPYPLPPESASTQAATAPSSTVPPRGAAAPSQTPRSADQAPELPTAEADANGSAVDHAAMGHGAHDEAVDHAAMGHGTHQQRATDEDGQPVPPSPRGEHEHHTDRPLDHKAPGHAQPAPTDQPRTPIPELTDLDRGAAALPAGAHPVHDNAPHSFVLLNRLDLFHADGSTGMEWEGQAWLGTDLNKIWLRSEGERAHGRTQTSALELLYGRPIARWWDLVAGIRHDFKPGPSQDFAAIGVIGLAPYKFEMEATGYIGQSGQTAVRLEVEYETLLTNKLILQPLVELNAHGQTDERRGIGAGLSTIEAGIRLRYEVTRQVAPYVGVVREWSFGRTADFRREDGEDRDDTRIVAGVRLWF